MVNGDFWKLVAWAGGPPLALAGLTMTLYLAHTEAPMHKGSMESVLKMDGRLLVIDSEMGHVREGIKEMKRRQQEMDQKLNEILRRVPDVKP